MVYIITRSEVNDYGEWKKSYDGAVDFRKSGGEKSSQLFRGVNNPNEVVLVREWENVEKWERFISSDEMANKQKESGVVVVPVVYILEKD